MLNVDSQGLGARDVDSDRVYHARLCQVGLRFAKSESIVTVPVPRRSVQVSILIFGVFQRLVMLKKHAIFVRQVNGFSNAQRIYPNTARRQEKTKSMLKTTSGSNVHVPIHH